MSFVKLDCGILNSTLWIDRDMREVFLTALLMAEPREFAEPVEQIAIRSLDFTGWAAPPGWYGFVSAASVGIIARACVDREAGLDALAKLGEPEQGSRSSDFDGRRLIRVNGGFVILNYMKYRERDYTSADRSRRYRERIASRRSVVASRRDITQAEAEAEVEVEVQKTHRAPAAQRAPLHTTHKGHAACGRVCVPAFLHSEFVRRWPGGDADKAVREWYLTVEAEWSGPKASEPADEPIAFWRARFAERWPAVASRPARVSPGDAWRPEGV